MTRRPRSHVLGDIAVSKLVHLFTERGWTSEVIHQDYGEDLLVRIFDSGVATSKFFFVQSKSTEDIEKFRAKSGYIKYRFKLGHVSMWRELRHPVIVTLFDGKSEAIYWQDVQSYISDSPLMGENRSTFLFHDEKILTPEHIDVFENHINTRYDHFDTISISNIALEEALEEQYGLEVDFGMNGVLILPQGRFVKDESGGSVMVTYGDVAKKVEKIEELGHDFKQVLMEGAEEESRRLEVLKRGEILQLKNSNGELVEEFSTLKEYQEKLVAKQVRS